MTEILCRLSESGYPALFAKESSRNRRTSSKSKAFICAKPWKALLRQAACMFQFVFTMTPTRLLRALPQRVACFTNSIAFGHSATVEVSDDFPGAQARGRAATPSLRSTQKRIFVDAEAAAIWRAFSDIERCGCAFSILSQKKF